MTAKGSKARGAVKCTVCPPALKFRHVAQIALSGPASACVLCALSGTPNALGTAIDCLCLDISHGSVFAHYIALQAALIRRKSVQATVLQREATMQVHLG